MIENAIKKLFENGERKVVIPGTGVILKRETGEMLFSDMLRHDDGRLASCIAGQNGIPNEQAVALLAAYADGIARDLARDGSATLRGIGTILRQSDGTYRIVTEVETREAEVDEVTARETRIVAEPVSVSEPMPQQPTVIAREPESEPQPQYESAPQHEELQSESQQFSATQSPQATAPATEQNFNRTTEVSKINKAKLRAALYGDEPEDEEDTPTVASVATPAPKTAPAATPAETVATSAATLFESASTTEPTAADRTAELTADNTVPQRPEIHIRRPGRMKRKPDVVMIAAIVALLIGLGVLLYGQITKKRLDIEDNYIETSIDSDATETSQS